MKRDNMFFMTFLILVKTLYYYALACHTKGTKIPLKEKFRQCNFVNVSEPLDKYNWNKKSVGLSAQPIFSLMPQNQTLQSFLASKITSNC